MRGSHRVTRVIFGTGIVGGVLGVAWMYVCIKVFGFVDFTTQSNYIQYGVVMGGLALIIGFVALTAAFIDDRLYSRPSAQQPPFPRVEEVYLDSYKGIGIRRLPAAEVNELLGKLALTLVGTELIINEGCAVRLRYAGKISVNGDERQQYELLIPFAFLSGTTLRLNEETVKALNTIQLPDSLPSFESPRGEDNDV